MKRGTFPIEKIELLRDLHDIGYSFRALAKWMRCAPWSVRYHLGAIDIEKHNRHKREQYAKK